MPLTVITLTNAPRALRGDLTKWMQEIGTGVYVGNFNARVREEIWERVKDSIKDGEASITYSSRTELGYSFESLNTSREIRDYEGIPLVFIAKKKELGERKKDFSTQARFRKAKKYSYQGGNNKPRFIVLDIETDGLDPKKDKIIELGAIEIKDKEIREYERLISYEGKLPEKIKALTGIDEELLKEEAKDIKESLIGLLEFISEKPIVGYNIDFDIKFLNKKLKELDLPLIRNKTFDLMKFVKRDKIHLNNYRLETVLKAYGINDKLKHRALEDSRLIYQLSEKVNKFQDQIKTKGLK